MKELWLDALEELVAETLEANPDLTEDAAYAQVNSQAIDARMADIMSARADTAADQHRDRQMEGPAL